MEEKRKTSIDKLLEYIEIIRDLYTNQQNLFFQKYLRDSETYHDFLNKIYNMYIGNHLFQIGMYKRNYMITTAILRGRDEYGTDESLGRESEITDRIKLIESQLNGHPFNRIRIFSKNDRELTRTIGFSSDEFIYAPYLLFSRIAQAGSIYRDNITLKPKEIKQKIEESKDKPSQEDSIIEIIKDENQRMVRDDLAKPKVKEQNYGPRILYFLYFANFALNYAETIDANFINQLEQIIAIGLEDIEDISRSDCKRFKEVSKITMRNVQKYKEKSMQRRETVQK